MDLVDPTSQGRVEVFDSVKALSEYTKTSGKFFPKENAYAGGVLKFLLRQIMRPPGEGNGRRRQGGRRGRGTSRAI